MKYIIVLVLVVAILGVGCGGKRAGNEYTTQEDVSVSKWDLHIPKIVYTDDRGWEAAGGGGEWITVEAEKCYRGFTGGVTERGFVVRCKTNGAVVFEGRVDAYKKQ